MTKEEKQEFCGHITMAARKIGIYGRLKDDGFTWFDPMARRTWLIPFELDKMETLFKACESLVNYLHVTT